MGTTKLGTTWLSMLQDTGLWGGLSEQKNRTVEGTEFSFQRISTLCAKLRALVIGAQVALGDVRQLGLCCG